jgi:uncharacterized protein YndB with AHSA1/START domain
MTATTEAKINTTSAAGRELFLTRIFDAPPDRVFRAWTDPAQLKHWFAPLPWTTSHVDMDVRAGGSSLIVLCDPNRVEYPFRGVFLEVIENRRLVYTDAFTKAWELSEKPFMTVVLTFEDLGDKTKYTLQISHWTLADREAHEVMGFHEGWTLSTDQLAALVNY